MSEPTIYPRVEYQMSEADLAELMKASRPVPMIVVGNSYPEDPQERANRAWAVLGRKMGFDPMTPRPVEGKGTRFFTAVPCENETQRAEREAKEKEAKRVARIAELEGQQRAAQAELDALRSEVTP